MGGLLLLIIAATYVAQGMQNTLLGAAWPAMYIGLGVPLAYLSILNTTIYIAELLPVC